VTIERTQDLELVRSILTHPRVYAWCGDDFAPDPEVLQLPADEHSVYLIARRREQVLGVMIFRPLSTVLWESHVAMLPAAWGYASVACDGGLRWMWEYSPACRIVATIPVSNRSACRLAMRLGMDVYGINPQSTLRGGKLEDQVLFGISRGSEAQTNVSNH
jgi:RimJ/RimL family protein N-acetyltransferase